MTDSVDVFEHPSLVGTRSTMNTVRPPEIVRIGAVTIIRPGVEFASLYGNMMDHLDPSLHLAASVIPPLLIIDLQNVKFIGSAFLGGIVTVQRIVRGRDSGRFGLCELNSFCKAAITISGLDKSFELFETAEDAVQAFSKSD